MYKDNSPATAYFFLKENLRIIIEKGSNTVYENSRKRSTHILSSRKIINQKALDMAQILKISQTIRYFQLYIHNRTGAF